jgi:hypothetical protein
MNKKKENEYLEDEEFENAEPVFHKVAKEVKKNDASEVASGSGGNSDKKKKIITDPKQYAELVHKEQEKNYQKYLEQKQKRLEQKRRQKEEGNEEDEERLLRERIKEEQKKQRLAEKELERVKALEAMQKNLMEKRRILVEDSLERAGRSEQTRAWKVNHLLFAEKPRVYKI